MIWFNPDRADPVVDDQLDAMLLAAAPDIRWSVANQARMHRRNGVPSYASTADAMTNWPETATAVAVRLITGDRVEVLAPLGLDDLFGLILRPTPFFLATGRLPVMTARIRDKRWLERWPKLMLAPEATGSSSPPGP
ncbi:hypothetical protein GCM10011505_47510 [Tistrella bauzanensis]|uniref:Uncharacterized protein n=1 Tax=Tistrella bauzanensis TaxID=657419 RepID=A0ABQ1J6Y0_9PROT|nr:hypothetical protein GCM10011505_47510 [Tistrella bauzanensis]